MIRTVICLLLFISLGHQVYAQNNNLDEKAASIPDENCSNVDALASYIKSNYTTDAERIRAIYIWITNHIKYDVPLFNSIEMNPDQEPQPVSKVLSERKAVCQGYADLFVALCNGVGINAMRVNGYTKIQGRLNHISHAWAAAVLDGKWYLFDPTWSAGYVQENRFVKLYNNGFYQQEPKSFVADHMPFDPMYQFLSYPLTNRDFISGSPASSKEEFNYADSLREYSQLSSVQQMAAELRRMVAAGIENDLLLKRRIFLKNALQSYGSKDAFDESTKDFNTAVKIFNRYIGFKNHLFANAQTNDLRLMLDSTADLIKISRSYLVEAIPKSDAQRQSKGSMMGEIERFWVRIKKEKVFLEQYIATDEQKRKQLFMRG
jgi:hypothetical protein